MNEAVRTDVQNIPLDKPVLVKQRGESVPFMAIRTEYQEGTVVDVLLGPYDAGYGWLVAITDLEYWVDAGALFAQESPV